MRFAPTPDIDKTLQAIRDGIIGEAFFHIHEVISDFAKINLPNTFPFVKFHMFTKYFSIMWGKKHKHLPSVKFHTWKLVHKFGGEKTLLFPPIKSALSPIHNTIPWNR